MSSEPALDLNCDLGEGEPPERTAAFMAVIDSANIAAGGHAGDESEIRRCLLLCAAHGVRAGAHPGWMSRGDFGRGELPSVTPAALTNLLEDQVGRVARRAGEVGVPLRHVKLHGALYHRVDDEAALAETYLRVVRQFWPGLIVFARAGGRIARLGAGLGMDVWEEGFLDRGYAADGTLIPRGEPRAVLGAEEAVRRWESLRREGGWRSVDGVFLALQPRTLCVHGDSPEALEILSRLRKRGRASVDGGESAE